MKICCVLHNVSPMKKFLLACSALFCVFPFAATLCNSAQAATITLTIAGTGSGSLDGNIFTDLSFQWVLVYDSTVFDSDWGANDPIFLNPTSTITLDGVVNPISVTEDHGVWVSNNSSLLLGPVRMSGGTPGFDILRIEGESAWAGITAPYDSTSITSADFSQFTSISTDQGLLTMNSGTVTSVSAVPEPATLSLLATVLCAGGVWLGRSRSRK